MWSRTHSRCQRRMMPLSQNGYIHDHQITIVMNLIETQIWKPRFGNPDLETLWQIPGYIYDHLMITHFYESIPMNTLMIL